MNSISYKLVVFWNKPDSEGKCPIMIRVTHDRKSVYKKTGYKVKKSEWDNGKIKGNVANSTITNSNLSKQLADIQRIFAINEMEGRSVSSQLIKKELTNPGADVDFYTIARDYIKINTDKFTPGYIKYLNGEITKLQQYSGAIDARCINRKFLEGYESWMRKRGNSQNTVWKSMKFIKTIINRAIKENGLKSNPFDDYKIRYVQTLRSHLSLSEIELIERFIDSGDAHDSLFIVGSFFVLSCYSGLRFSDLVNFSPETSVRDGRLILSTTKTGEIVSIFITDKIKKAINRVSNKRLYTNQICNDYLKIIAEITGIDKNLTFHIARHSFAVNSASLGIPMEVVSVLLGHRNIKTTAIYYKISNPKIDSEMAKWN